MKSDWSRNFYTQIAVNIFYSALIACLVDAFLIMNINLLLAYLDQTRYANMMIFQIFRMGTVTTILYVLIGIGVFSLTLLLLERKTMKYIGKIAMAIQNISEGDLNIQIEVVGDDECSAMASNLNRMEADIRKLMDKERESERTKNELITNVAHDLRTPLTMIIAYAEVMRDLPGENSPENVQVVIDEAERLTNLVNDMLDISKLQAGVMEKNVTVYNLTESIQSVFARYNKLKEQDGYKIDFSYDQMVMVEADEYKIFQVIYNLVDNAIKFCNVGGEIRFSVTQSKGAVTVGVRNTGAGIAPEALPYVFDRFYKEDKSRGLNTTGSGLGLHICKVLINLSGGKIWVDSKEGEYCEFLFTLPAPPSSPIKGGKLKDQ